MDSESVLPGGWVSSAVRVGDRVHRGPGPNAAFVHELLDHLAAAVDRGAALPRRRRRGPGDPRLRPEPTGVDPAIRARARQDAPLVELTRLVRELHDLTAGTALAGDQEVVCHHDLDPRNTVYREHDEQLTPATPIDWDLAAPAGGSRTSPTAPGSSCRWAGRHRRRGHGPVDAVRAAQTWTTDHRTLLEAALLS